MKNKKIILGMGTIATIIAPLAAVVSCGSSKETPGPKINNIKDAINYAYTENVKKGIVFTDEFKEIVEPKKIIGDINKEYLEKITKKLSKMIEDSINALIENQEFLNIKKINIKVF